MWPLWDGEWDGERFAKDLRKGSFWEPLFSPTFIYSCVDRTGPIWTNWPTRLKKLCETFFQGESAQLIRFLGVGILKIPVKHEASKQQCLILTSRPWPHFTRKILAGKERSGSCRVSKARWRELNWSHLTHSGLSHFYSFLLYQEMDCQDLL